MFFIVSQSGAAISMHSTGVACMSHTFENEMYRLYVYANDESRWEIASSPSRSEVEHIQKRILIAISFGRNLYDVRFMGSDGAPS